jgi:hypothetical protein
MDGCTGLERSRDRSIALRFPASRKAWVAFPGHPSNACVRPKDGFTASRKTNAIRALRGPAFCLAHSALKFRAHVGRRNGSDLRRYRAINALARLCIGVSTL